jgi:coenzyme F420-reducing hydrogenase delta subunit
MKVAQLTIEMAANVARLQKDMAAAQRSVESTMGRIRKSADSAMRALGALGVGLSIGAFANWIKGAIDAIDKLNDISAATGITVTKLAGLDYAAKLSGTSLDAVTQASNKLQLSLTTNNAALTKVGVTAQDPIEALAQLADVYSATEGQSNKAAVASLALGKSWQSIAGVLAQGGDGLRRLIAEGEALSGVTQQTADDAGKFNDEMDKLGTRLGALALNIAGPILKVFSEFIDELNEGTKAAGGFWNAIGMFGTTNPFLTLEESAAKYRKEVEELTEKQQKNSELANLAFGTNEKLATATQRLAYFEGMLAIEARKAAAALAEGAAGANAHVGAYNSMIAAADDLIEQMQIEFSLIGLTNEERAVSIAMRKLEEIGIRQGTEAFEKYVKEILEIQKRIGIKKEMVRLSEEAGKNAKREAEEYDRLLKSFQEQIAKMQIENETYFEGNAARERAIFLRETENLKIEDRSRLLAQYDEAAAIKDANEQRKKSIDKQLEQQKDYAKEMEKISDQIGQSLTDALMNGGMNAKEFLINMFKTMVLRPLLQPIVSGVVGAFASTAMAGTAQAATGGTISNSMGLVGLASTLKSAYQMVTGGFAQLGATVTSSVQGLGASLILENAPGSVLSSMGQSLASSASALGTIASYGAGIGAGLGIGNLISGGKGIGGGSSWLTVGGGTAIGAMIGGPLGAAIGGVVGGLANAAFGTGKKEIDDTGIKVRFNSMKTTVEAYEEWSKSGGWFGGGGEGVEISAVDKNLQKYFDTAVASTAVNVKRYADVLGLSAAGISDFTFEVKQSLAGLSPEEAQKEIDRIITAYGNAMASVVTSEIGPVLREGEEAGVALARLASSLNTVNTVFGTLNLKLMETSIYGADAASTLIELFGGIEEFTKSTDYYYQNFYSTQERVAKTTEQLTGVFEQLGYALPSSRAAFRSLVESVQAAGNPNLFATLMQLAPAFNDLATATEQLISSGGSISGLAGVVASVDTAFASLKETIDRELKSALDGLQRGYDSLIKTLELQKQTAEAAKSVSEESLTAINSVFDLLKDQINSILGEVLPAQTAAQGSAFISDALLAAQTTGYLPESNALSSAIAAARTGLGASNFTTSLEMKMANMRLVAQLTGIQDIAGEQKSVAELQLEISTKQLESLDAQIEQAKSQYDADVAATQAYYDNQLQMAQNQVNELRGINGSVITMTQALAAFGAAVNAERSSSVSNDNERTAAISQMYLDILRRAPDPAGLASWVSSGKSLEDVRAGILGSQEAKGFANGGYYPGGMAMVGERGPELIDFNNPGQVYSNDRLRSAMGGEDVATEIRALREENRIQSRAMVSMQSRMTRMIERWDGDGLPNERYEDATA